MGQVQLESFETDTILAEEPDKGFAQGFTEGHAAGLAEAQATQANLANELVQSIADLEFKYEEARNEITRAMGPLLTSLTDKIFPQCIADGFGDQIAARVLETAMQQHGGQLRLCIHPQHHEAVTAALSTVAVSVNIATDATLQPHAAWIEHEAGALSIDCDKLLNEIRMILSSVGAIQQRSEMHGHPD